MAIIKDGEHVKEIIFVQPYVLPQGTILSSMNSLAATRRAAQDTASFWKERDCLPSIQAFIQNFAQNESINTNCD